MKIRSMVFNCAFVAALSSAIAIMAEDRRDGRALANEWRGRCAETKVGAVGLFYAAFIGNRIELMFPSGTREKYNVSDINAVECPKIASR